MSFLNKKVSILIIKTKVTIKRKKKKKKPVFVFFRPKIGLTLKGQSTPMS